MLRKKSNGLPKPFPPWCEAPFPIHSSSGGSSNSRGCAPSKCSEPCSRLWPAWAVWNQSRRLENQRTRELPGGKPTVFAIENGHLMVDIPIESHWTMLIFHSYANVYQRVSINMSNYRGFFSFKNGWWRLANPWELGWLVGQGHPSEKYEFVNGGWCLQPNINGKINIHGNQLPPTSWGSGTSILFCILLWVFIHSFSAVSDV